MADEEREPRGAKFRAYLPSDPNDPRLDVQIAYGNVRLFIVIEDSDEGASDLADLLQYVPKIVATARGESAIRKEMRGVDNELFELLGDPE